MMEEKMVREQVNCDNTDSTQSPYQRIQSINMQKKAILMKISYLTDYTVYENMDKYEFSNLLNRLSKNSRHGQCFLQIINLLWNKSPKQPRGGVNVEKLAKLVAEYIVDNKYPQMKQYMIDVFVSLESDQKNPKSSKRMIQKLKKNRWIYYFPIIFQGFRFGLHLIQYKPEQIGNTAKQVKQGAVESNIENLISSKRYGSYSQAINPTFNSAQLQSDIPNSTVDSNVASGRVFTRLQQVFRTVFQFLGKRCLSVRNFFLRMFFEKTNVEKAWKFSPIHSLCSIYQMLQYAALVYYFSLMFRKQKENSKIYQKDEFFVDSK